MKNRQTAKGIHFKNFKNLISPEPIILKSLPFSFSRINPIIEFGAMKNRQTANGIHFKNFKNLISSELKILINLDTKYP